MIGVWLLSVPRLATAYGHQVTEEIVTDLVHNNITIVSGLARAVSILSPTTRRWKPADGLSLCGLRAGYHLSDGKHQPGKTNHRTRRARSANTRWAPTKPEYFPRRNRILSGISLGVLVTEAGETSGALITADQALEQNRDVLAVPGSVFSPASCGTNHLIQQGAKLVRNCQDILEELNLQAVAQQLEF